MTSAGPHDSHSDFDFQTMMKRFNWHREGHSFGIPTTPGPRRGQLKRTRACSESYTNATRPSFSRTCIRVLDIEGPGDNQKQI